jgi:hypothetical protein
VRLIDTEYIHKVSQSVTDTASYFFFLTGRIIPGMKIASKEHLSVISPLE